MSGSGSIRVSAKEWHLCLPSLDHRDHVWIGIITFFGNYSLALSAQCDLLSEISRARHGVHCRILQVDIVVSKVGIGSC